MISCYELISSCYPVLVWSRKCSTNFHKLLDSFLSTIAAHRATLRETFSAQMWLSIPNSTFLARNSATKFSMWFGCVTFYFASMKWTVPVISAPLSPPVSFWIWIEFFGFVSNILLLNSSIFSLWISSNFLCQESKHQSATFAHDKTLNCISPARLDISSLSSNIAVMNAVFALSHPTYLFLIFYLPHPCCHLHFHNC